MQGWSGENIYIYISWEAKGEIENGGKEEVGEEYIKKKKAFLLEVLMSPLPPSFLVTLC